MRIFIDCTHTANHTYKNTGIHRVVRQITHELLDISSNASNLEVIPVKFDGIFISRVASLDEKNENHSPITKSSQKLNSQIHQGIGKIKKLLFNYLIISNRKSDFSGIKFSSADIYLIPDANWDLPESYYYFLQYLIKNKVAIVSICHDLIPIKFPELCPQKFVKGFNKFYYKYSDCFDKVICVSNKSAEDYREAKQQGILPNSNTNQIVSSFRLGSDYSKDKKLHGSGISNISKNNKLLSLVNQRYILVVGSLVPHKNIKTIVAAFDLLVEKNYSISLIFAGNRGRHNDTDILIEKNKMYGSQIHILDSVTDEDLKILYENCYCLVQASFYEGFGLPVVEALRYSKPVISSNSGSLPEVGGDFCLYFDPNDTVQLKQALEKLLNSDDFYDRLVNRIKNEYVPFSWKDSARQLLSLLNVE